MLFCSEAVALCLMAAAVRRAFAYIYAVSPAITFIIKCAVIGGTVYMGFC